uniref:Uncharacterized protein n=1 Tax=Salix viminalis TaxID=40686 RepID=A0A6N2KCW7_SALVM
MSVLLMANHVQYLLTYEGVRVDSQTVVSPNAVAAIGNKGSELAGALFTLGSLKIWCCWQAFSFMSELRKENTSSVPELMSSANSPLTSL